LTLQKSKKERKNHPFLRNTEVFVCFSTIWQFEIFAKKDKRQQQIKPESTNKIIKRIYKTTLQIALLNRVIKL